MSKDTEKNNNNSNTNNNTNNTEELYLPIVFLPYDIILPFCRGVLHPAEFVNVSNLAFADNTHKKFFLPLMKANAEKNPSERDICLDVIVNDGKNVEVPMFGVVCRIDHAGAKDNVGCELFVTGLTAGICKSVEFDPSNCAGLCGTVEVISDSTDWTSGVYAPMRRLISREAKRFAKLYEKMEPNPLSISEISGEKDALIVCYRALSLVEPPMEKALEVLQESNPEEKLKLAWNVVRDAADYIKVESEIVKRTGNNINNQRRDAFLREQLRVLEDELGEGQLPEIAALIDKLEELEDVLPREVTEKIESELARLRMLPPTSPDFSVVYMHAEFLLKLPWKKDEVPEISLDAVKKVLDRDHYGLDKVKKRIVEFMAVKTMKKATASSIICLVGPPGTGKTSIVRSVAEAIGRKYTRISLGGIRDDADIRGHRKTYVGAMPGRILSAISKVGSRCPLILLDEIDKLCKDSHGDPAAALLEALDPEQNKNFTDSYAEVPFDLSEVFFITTANSLDTIPAPLLDRMEVIELTSYTEDEKLAIAKKHLIPKLLKSHGLSRSSTRPDDECIRSVITRYTDEAGVRELERQLAAIIRKLLVKYNETGELLTVVTKDMLPELLGAGKIIHRFETSGGLSEVGVVNGMAWTAVGGVLLEVEVNVFDGTGKIEITGSIGEVMKESCTAAVSFIRANAERYNVPADFYRTKDIHVHVPEGATPKDGPSAGVTITTAIISALTGVPVRKSVAMTGEITIRGNVLAIGGLKEKSLAALKNGISEIIIPAENEPDIEELPKAVKKGLKITMAKKIDEVLDRALVRNNL